MSLKLPDNVMVHMSAPYDPVKRHQYYEQHKHLKGRQPGAGKLATNPAKTGAKVVPIRKSLHSEANQAAVHERVQAITAKLQQLRAHLQELLKKAGQSSSPSKSSTTTKKTTQKKPQTAAQKAAQKKAAKKSAQKRHQKAQTNSAPTVTEQIAQVRAQIRQVEENLRAAVAQARQQAAASHSQTA